MKFTASTFLFGTVVFLSVPLMHASVPLFRDVSAGAWYTGYVDEAVEAGIASGYRNADGSLTGTFGPTDPVTSAQALKMVMGGAGYDINAFTDEHPGQTSPGAPCTHWVCPYYRITRARNMLFNTCGTESSFDVDIPLDRSHMAYLLAESFGVLSTDPLQAPTTDLPNRFQDVRSVFDSSTGKQVIDRWAYAINALARDGVITGDKDASGKPTGTFRPNANLNRAEAVALILRAREKYGKPGSGKSGIADTRILPCTGGESDSAWQNYEDATIGISISYPANYAVRPYNSDNIIHFGDSDIVPAGVYIGENMPGGQGIQFYRTRDMKIMDFLKTQNTFTKIKTINGIVWQEYACTGGCMGDSYGYVTEKDGWYYVFESMWGPDNPVSERMLESLEFAR